MRLNYDDDDPHLDYDCHIGHIRADASNTTVFLHGYEYRGVDHIFTATGETELSVVGVWLWRITSNEVELEFFDEVADEMEQTGFDTRRSYVPDEGDLMMFNKQVKKMTPKITNKKIKKWITSK
jgi:hypothetical protein